MEMLKRAFWRIVAFIRRDEWCEGCYSRGLIPAHPGYYACGDCALGDAYADAYASEPTP